MIVGCLKPANLAQRRYQLRMIASAGFSIVFSLAAKMVIRSGHLPHGAAYLVAILPAFPIMAALVVTGVYLSEETDEFQRQILIEALLGGMGITLAGTTVWGYMESMASVPHLDAIWIYPIFWLATVASVPFVWMRYR